MADLTLVLGIIEQDQHPAPGDPCPEQLGTLLDAVRKAGISHPERPQEAAKNFGRGDWRLAHAVEMRIQLAIRIRRRDLPSHVNGECRLPRTGGSRDDLRPRW